MCCGLEPTNRSNSNVDHIKCRKYYPYLALDIDNLQVLCGSCNKIKCNNHSTDYRDQTHAEVITGQYSDWNIDRLLRSF